MADSVPNADKKGIETFERLIYSCRNQHIAAGIAPLILFRQELVGNDEFRNRSGIDDTTRNHLLAHLLNCDKLRRTVTYNPDDSPLGDQVAKAIDPNAPLVMGVKPAAGDEVQAQSGRLFYLPYAFDGTDPDLPMLSALKITSPAGMMLLNAIDIAIVTWSRLESRNMTKWITVMDSMRVYGEYQGMLTLLKMFAGDDNKVDVANVLPSEEPLGPASSANFKTEPTSQTSRMA